ncbi:MAG: dethiobiotin synthase [Anaeromyxobacter sp.]
MRGLFVVGTDTGVGKTEVSCALLAAWRAQGRDVVAMKPAQSGVTPGEPTDAERLHAAMGGALPLDEVCPYTFAAPLAPGVAARLEGKELSLSRILDHASRLAAAHEAVLVEGAGGLVVPLTARETYADLAVALGLPVLVVARAGLGTVNHTALTLEALERRGLRVAGLVLNRTGPVDDPSVPHNAYEIARLTGREPVAVLPWVPDIGARGAALGSELAAKIHF